MQTSRSYQPANTTRGFSDMAVMFTGHRLHYVCDSETDINPVWEVGSCIYVINSNQNYMMCSSGVCAVAQIQSDWSESNSGLLDFIKNKPAIPNVTRATSLLTLTLVGTGATGTQISSTKDSTVRGTVLTQATATIAGAAVSTVTAKICATNSATESDWSAVGDAETSASYSLALTLQGINGAKEQICFDVPAGWFCKFVASGSGTHSEAWVRGQKTIYG